MIERAEALNIIMGRVETMDLVLTTIGMISRAVFAGHDRPGNFYMIGSMGLVSSLGLGLALILHSRRVFVLEGDGSALMSLGTLSLIGAECPDNLIHIILDNESYESTGGQVSISSKIDLADVGRSCGYQQAIEIRELDTLDAALANCRAGEGPFLFLVKVAMAQDQEIQRVSRSPVDLRDRFRSFILKES